jgi:hypothetical protein
MPMSDNDVRVDLARGAGALLASLDVAESRTRVHAEEEEQCCGE